MGFFSVAAGDNQDAVQPDLRPAQRINRRCLEYLNFDRREQQMQSDTVLMIIDMMKGVASPDHGSGKASAAAGQFNSYFYERVGSVVRPNIARLMRHFRKQG